MKKKNAGILAGNNEPQNPSEITQVGTKSKRGRKKGVPVGEKPPVIIQINDLYRINLSDGRCKTLQKAIVKVNDTESEDLTEDEKKSGWTNKGYWITYKAAFDKLHELMIEDKIKDKDGIVTVKEFYEIYKEKLAWLKEVFISDFKDDEVVRKPKYVKKIEEKGKK